MKPSFHLVINSVLITLIVSSNIAWYITFRRLQSKNKDATTSVNKSYDKTGQRFLYTPYTDSACVPYHSMNEAAFEELIRQRPIHDTLEIGSSGKVLQSFGDCNRLIICRHAEKSFYYANIKSK